MITKEYLEGSVAVIALKGKMMGDDETLECHRRVKRQIGQEIRHIVLDFDQVEWVNSRGLGMLIACFTSCRNAGGDLKLVKVSGKTLSLLRMTKLEGVFEIYDDVTTAVKACRKDP